MLSEALVATARYFLSLQMKETASRCGG